MADSGIGIYLGSCGTIEILPTREKPSFLLYGKDCRSPSEAAYLPMSEISPATVSDYREELMISLSSARNLAVKTTQMAQAKYKNHYDKNAREVKIQVGR